MTGSAIFEFEGHSFDPDHIQAMAVAFDNACVQQPDAVRDIIAKIIVDFAKCGERDPGHLCKLALASVSISAMSKAATSVPPTPRASAPPEGAQ